MSVPKSGEQQRYVFAVRPKCPSCGADKLKTIRSTTDEDGSRMQRKICDVCGEKFKIVWE